MIADALIFFISLYIVVMFIYFVISPFVYLKYPPLTDGEREQLRKQNEKKPMGPWMTETEVQVT